MLGVKRLLHICLVFTLLPKHLLVRTVRGRIWCQQGIWHDLVGQLFFVSFLQLSSRFLFFTLWFWLKCVKRHELNSQLPQICTVIVEMGNGVKWSNTFLYFFFFLIFYETYHLITFHNSFCSMLQGYFVVIFFSGSACSVTALLLWHLSKRKQFKLWPKLPYLGHQ